MNLEYLKAEYFLHGAFGHGLDYFASNLTKGGPPPATATSVSTVIQAASLILSTTPAKK